MPKRGSTDHHKVSKFYFYIHRGGFICKQLFLISLVKLMKLFIMKKLFHIILLLIKLFSILCFFYEKMEMFHNEKHETISFLIKKHNKYERVSSREKYISWNNIIKLNNFINLTNEIDNLHGLHKLERFAIYIYTSLIKWEFGSLW